MVWLCARTKPSRELWAAENVVNQGHDYYLPRTLEQVIVVGISGTRKEMRAKVLFPGFLFVRTNGEWHFLLGTFGVSLILFGNSPAVVPDKVIDAMKAREVNGYVELPAPKQQRRKVGDAVRVRDGAFSGHVGIYQGMNARDRSKVLLDMLGQKTNVLIADALLEAV
jgi:transcription antitermination factor NusG